MNETRKMQINKVKPFRMNTSFATNEKRMITYQELQREVVYLRNI